MIGRKMYILVFFTVLFSLFSYADSRACLNPGELFHLTYSNFQEEKPETTHPAKKTSRTDSISVESKLKEAEQYIHVDDRKAFQLTREALDAATGSDNYDLIGKAQNALGNLHWFTGDYNHASTYYFSALKNFQKTADSFQTAVCYRNIGWIYMGQQKYTDAETYFQKSLTIMKKLHREADILIAYDDLATLCQNTGDYRTGLHYCKLSISLAKKTKNREALGTTLMTKGNLEFSRKNYSDAKADFLESIYLLKHLSQSSYNLCLAYLGLSRVYLTINRSQLAKETALLAVKQARKSQLTKELAEAYELLATVYQGENNFERAFDYMHKFSVVKDTLNARNNRQFIQSMAANFEMQQNEMHIQNLEQKEKLAETQLNHERSFKVFLVIILILSLVLGIIAYRSFLNKKKDNQALGLAYAEIESKNKDISDSISYALNIQQARLPHLDNLKERFRDCCVVYLPRDIVSGDFYWHNTNDDGKQVLAIADCTGHGIPGAFMSMMGIDGFNYAILEKRIDQPKEILSLVNHFIKDSLRQKENTVRSKDGMDVALCTFSENLDKVTYAGANRPLWIYRDGKILEYKPQKISIGGNHLEDYAFSDEEISLQTDDMLYLFSDGYADQFGGEKNKKFMSRQLKALIERIGSLPAREQEAIFLHEFHEWKGELSQVDDVVLIGIRI